MLVTTTFALLAETFGGVTKAMGFLVLPTTFLKIAIALP
jgi:hypothetical protein